MPLQPSRWLVTCLRVLMSRDAANAAVGDALEELAERTAAGRAPHRPRAWLNRRIAGAVAVGVGNSLPRGLRTGGLTLRDAARSLRAAPWHSAFIVGILAVAMALASVTFAVVDAVMLKPLPYPDADRLVQVSPTDDTFKVRLTPELFVRLRAELRTAETFVATSQTTGAQVTVDGKTSNRSVQYVERVAFDQLGLRPGVGRVWTTDEEQTDARVAVIGYRFWVERLGGTPDVLQRTLTLGEEQESFRIIGVLAADSDQPSLPAGNSDVWIPRRVETIPPGNRVAARARLRVGETPRSLAFEIQHVAATPDWVPNVRPLRDVYLRADTTRWMWLALAASFLVVVVASANVANLMLARAGARTQELAVRASLGASRARLAATQLAEGLLLSMVAGMTGVVAAIGGAQFVRAELMGLPFGIFRADTVAIDSRVLIVAIFAAIAVGVSVALLSAWSVTRAPASDLLKQSEGTTFTGRQRWGRVLLTAEVAAVTILTVISSLFVGSLVRMLVVDVGVDTSRLIAVRSRFGFRAPIHDVKQRLEAVPGVAGVSMSGGASLPFVGGVQNTVALLRPHSTSADDVINVLDYRVTPNYFGVAGLRFTLGGTWTDETVADSPAVVLDQRTAQQLFGNENPLGKLLRPVKAEREYRVVGVVPYVPIRGPEAVVPSAAYFSYQFNPTRGYAEFFVRTNEPVEVAVRRITEALGPLGPPGDEPYVFAADEALRRLTAMRRFTAGLMSVFGLVGLLIGAAGVYAVMASVVSQQTRDIGIRMALGASAQRIAKGVFTMAGWHVCIGLAIGVPAAWWLSRGFASLLFGVTPTDISVYATVGAVLTVTAFAAAWLPARRAARVDPIVSLRN
jgi:predicted permease